MSRNATYRNQPLPHFVDPQKYISAALPGSIRILLGRDQELPRLHSFVLEVEVHPPLHSVEQAIGSSSPRHCLRGVDEPGSSGLLDRPGKGWLIHQNCLVETVGRF